MCKQVCSDVYCLDPDSCSMLSSPCVLSFPLLWLTACSGWICGSADRAQHCSVHLCLKIAVALRVSKKMRVFSLFAGAFDMAQAVVSAMAARPDAHYAYER